MPRHVLAALHATVEYQIDQLAINYFGDFFDAQRYPYQLSNFRQIAPNTHLHLYARPREGNIDLLQSCAHLKLRVQEDVSFTDSKLLAYLGVSQESLNALYCGSYAFLTTTLGEGLGLTVNEAIAAGVPVIAPATPPSRRSWRTRRVMGS